MLMPIHQPIDPKILDENRLRVLHETGLLDSPPENEFDRFTYLAKFLLCTPIALITLVDKDRQFFKSSTGLPEPLASERETPLSHSFCQHVVSSEQPLEVEDATTHEVLCHNPAVSELNVIAYLGVPLCTRSGHVIGAICAIDNKLHTWTEADREHMNVLAQLVMTEIELRNQLAARKATEERLIKKAQELERANEELQAVLLKEKKLTGERDHAIGVSRLKSQFLAMVSHEIRTPLNGIIGMADLMTYTNLTEEQTDYLRIINSSGNHLLSLINDLLDLSRIESGKMSLDYQHFDLHRVVADTMEIFIPKASEKDLDLAYMIDRAVPQHVHGDIHRYRQILSNLVDNAIKFTLEGKVEVKITALKAEATVIAIRADVHDTGIGISPDQVDRLFKPFSQVDSSANRNYEGSGLGLVISKRLADLMGGCITVTSEPGKGSIFQVDVVFRR